MRRPIRSTARTSFSASSCSGSCWRASPIGLCTGRQSPSLTLEPWQRTGSAIVHWSLYVLLIVLPILGWIGISLYPALDIFGLFSLPALTSANQELANQVLAVHASLAWLLIVLVIGHAGMALFHYFVRKDNVLRRMLTGLPKR